MVERLKQLVRPPVFPGDEAKTHLARFLYGWLAMTALAMLVVIASAIVMRTAYPIWINELSLAFVLLAFLLIRRGYVRTVGWLYLVGFWAIATAYLLTRAG